MGNTYYSLPYQIKPFSKQHSESQVLITPNKTLLSDLTHSECEKTPMYHWNVFSYSKRQDFNFWFLWENTPWRWAVPQRTTEALPWGVAGHFAALEGQNTLLLIVNNCLFNLSSQQCVCNWQCALSGVDGRDSLLLHSCFHSNKRLSWQHLPGDPQCSRAHFSSPAASRWG